MASPGAAALRRYANVRKSALSNKLEFGANVVFDGKLVIYMIN